MVRKNEKMQIVNYENSIQKSKEFSFSKLINRLNLNQIQLLAFTIFSAQKNGVTEFHKADFEKKFGLSKYNTQEAYADVDALSELKVKIKHQDLKKESYRLHQFLIFREISYEKGLFSFQWDSEIVPHILNLQDKLFTNIDLTITTKFKSEFSWFLYDELKTSYGYWHKPYTKEKLMELFKVADKKTYQQNTGRFKTTVLDTAIAEINKHTELNVWYKEEKQGRAIVGFDIHWSSGKNVASATKKQIKELKTILDVVFDDVYKYTDLELSKGRQRAIELILILEGFRKFTSEPICITKERADSLLKEATSHLGELEHLYKTDLAQRGQSEQPPVKPLVNQTKNGFYNWLDVRE